ncbi:hypothetical protein IE53DRAFT_173744 [Violaceomyces palustris]|uniref:Uncharacterized protein n=1 Tax=Violaceomyces palustris TaxID=1673888 RepID=A0ACD0NSQ8_9BASI|nr:hypothetical protein IE53DRAFT_173744 [Violaceomyces palustris]
MNVPTTASSSPAQAPPMIQLDQWSNTKASLSASQRSSVNKLAEWLHKKSRQHQQDRHRRLPQASHHPTLHSTKPPLSSSSGRDPEREAKSPSSSNGIPSAEADSDQAKVPTSSSSSDLPFLLPSPQAPLTSAPEFLSWFTSLSASLSARTQSSHQKALAAVSRSAENADALLSQLEAAQVHVAELRAGAAFVEDSSKGLRNDAQALLDHYDQLESLSTQIESRLSYFTLLPYATSLLSSPDPNLAYQPAFLPLLDHLETSLAFLRSSPADSYKDAALYRMRYAQCVTRACSLAKISVVRDFKNQAEASARMVRKVEGERAQRKIQEREKGKAREGCEEDELSPLSESLEEPLYTSFKSLVPRMKPLIIELERRAFPQTFSIDGDGKRGSGEGGVVETKPTIVQHSNAAEFASLLDECRSSWFYSRRNLTSRLIMSRLAQIERRAFEMDSNGPDAIGSPLAVLAKEGTLFVQEVCQRERRLYREFFAAPPPTPPSRGVEGDPGRSVTLGQELSNDPMLKAYLEGVVIESLHNRLRPRVLREGGVDILSKVCRALIDASIGSVVPLSTLLPASGQEADSPGQQPKYTKLLRPILQEVQSRLIFRSQAYVSSEISNFVPREEDGDLDFPGKLERAHQEAELKRRAREGGGVVESLNAPNYHRRGKSSVGGAGLLEAVAVMMEKNAVWSGGGTSDVLQVAASAQSDETVVGASREEGGAQVRLFALPSSDVTRTYHKPLLSLLRLLSHLDSVIPISAFQELGYESIESCRLSIESASGAIARKSGGRQHGWLFQIRHLSLLREVAVSVRLVSGNRSERDGKGRGGMEEEEEEEEEGGGEGSTPLEGNHSYNVGLVSLIDLEGLVGALNSLWSNTGARILNPSSGGSAIEPDQTEKERDDSGAPRTASKRMETRVFRNLEQSLSKSVQQLTRFWAESATLPLKVWLDRNEADSRAGGEEGKSHVLKGGQDSKVESTYEAFLTCCESNLESSIRDTVVYLEDEEIRKVIKEGTILLSLRAFPIHHSHSLEGKK